MKKRLHGFLTLFLALVVQLSFAQVSSVTGTVSDEEGISLPGVNVIVQGTNTGTQTDFDGKYSINASTGQTLVFSYVGYASESVTVGTLRVIDVSLQQDNALEEVVITTLGISRDEKSVGFATQNIKTEELTKTNISDFSKALQGKVAGVDVKMSSGMPGASSQITIRGSRSFTGNNTPLYVIDGMPVATTASFSTGNSVTGADISNRALDINPNDIESVSILKGQAASALYGIRASNGVVLITTKSGKGGPLGKPVVTINQTTSFEMVSRTPDYQSTWAQGINGNFNPTSSTSWGPKISDLPNNPTYGGNGNGHEGMYRVPQLERAGLDPWVTPQVYDNWNDYFRVGRTATTSVNVSQNGEKGNFSIGIANTTQDGIALNTGMTRWNAKANADLELSEHFTTGFSTNFSTNTIDKLSGANDGSLAGVLAAPASYNLKGIPYNEPGDPYKQIYYRSLTFDNPYWIEKNHTFNEGTDRFFGNGFINYTTELGQDMNLNVRYQLGIDSYSSSYQDIFGYGWKGGTGQINNYGTTQLTYNSLLTANYDWQFTEDFNLSVSVGNELNHNKEKYYSQYGQEFNFGGWNHIGNANIVTADETQRQDRFVAFFSNLSLSWKDVLFLNATGRNDIVSTMPRDSRSFFYPSVGLGFVVSELDFVKDVSWISFAKLRGSYAEVGQAGRYLPNNYTKPSYGGGFWAGEPITYPLDGINSYTPSSVLFDPGLTPQNTKSYEFGVDLKMFNNRLGIDYAISRQNVEDQIFSVPLAASTGASSLYTNGGSVRTEAHELMLYATPIKTEDFSWDVSVNYTKIDNVVEELAEGVESIFLGGFTTPQVRAGIGATYPVLYGDQFAKNEKGQILVDEDPNSPSYGMPMVGAPGVLGSISPDFIIGGTTNFTFKAFSLGAVFEMKSGGHMYSGSNGLLDLYGMSERTEDRESTFIYNGYKADGTPNDIARGGPSDPNAMQTLYSDVLGNIDEYYIFGNSYVKLRELSLRYDLPKKLIPSMDLSISTFARNILLWTELPNFDPESSQGNNNMAGGFERFSLPQATSFGMNLEIKF